MKKKDLSQIKNTPTLVTNNGALILSQTLKKLDFLFKGHQISHWAKVLNIFSKLLRRDWLEYTYKQAKLKPHSQKGA